MLARVLWFISTRPSDSTFLPLKITWGGLIIGAEVLLVVAASLACRGFGWRIYSRLRVDYRLKNASRLLRLGLLANLFNTLVKLDLIFLVTVAALGVDVAIERREEPDATLLIVSAITLVSGIILVGIALTTVTHESWATRLNFISFFLPFAFAGPIALCVIYKLGDADIANAGTSVIIASCVLVATDIALWIALHNVVKNRGSMEVAAGRVMLRRMTGEKPSGNDSKDNGSAMPVEESRSVSSSCAKKLDLEGCPAHDSNSNEKTKLVSTVPDSASDPFLAPLMEGAWLGKPSPRNPNKIRFFQLSLDGSTLRWGWKR